MKRHISTILLVLVFLIGVSLLLYPTLSDWWNDWKQSRAVADYVEQVANIDKDQYAEIWNAARQYNDSLLNRPNHYLLSEKQAQEYPHLLNVGGNGIMGYVEIPSINETLPLYHGTDGEVLQVAIGHLEWSSLPVGGESSHCVVSGHRGLPSSRLFTDLDQLAEGDIFLLRVLDEVLTYQVDQILVVEPHVTEDLLIVEGQDLCTLVTCTPYGINTHRLLVRGHRVVNSEMKDIRRVTTEATRIEPLIVAPLAASPLLLVLLFAVILPKKRTGKEK